MISFTLAGLLLGLLFGSFLNVCIARVPLGESVVSPRSHCMMCGHAIRWYDNVPLLSWLVLRGRCRDCRAAISWQYPAVELALGLWGAISGSLLWHAWFFVGPLGVGTFSEDHSFQATTLVLGFAILGFLLIGLIVMDWQTLRLPDAFTLSGIGVGILLVCTQAVFLGPKDDQVVLNTTHQLRLRSPGSFAAQGNVFLTGPENLIYTRLLAVIGAALLLLAVRWGYRWARKRDGLGLGDVKMLAMIAAFLGFWPAILTLFAGTLLASVFGTAQMLRGHAHGQTKLPLGSFLGIGGLFAALFGEQMIGWYRSLFS